MNRSMLRYHMHTWPTKAWMRLAWLLPKRLVYSATIRLGAAATTGRYSDTVVPDLSLMDAIGRWDDLHKVES